MEELEKKNEMKRTEEDVKVINDAMVSIMVKMPMKQWVEWNEDCKMMFGDCRWMKMWNDHLVAQNKLEVKDLIIELIAEMRTQNKKETTKEKKSPLTFGEAKETEE